MQSLTNSPVAKKFMDKKRGGEYQDLPSKNFSLTVPKNSQGNYLLFHSFQVSKNVRDKMNGKALRFSAENFCLIVPKIL